MTAPAKGRPDSDHAGGRDQVRTQVADAKTNKLAVERVVNLLNEIVATGTLPVL